MHGTAYTIQVANNLSSFYCFHSLSSQESPESLLRSALQGKGYTTKTLHLQQQQNGITVIPAQNSTVKDEELRRVLFTNDQVRDSAVATPTNCAT